MLNPLSTHNIIKSYLMLQVHFFILLMHDDFTVSTLKIRILLKQYKKILHLRKKNINTIFKQKNKLNKSINSVKSSIFYNSFYFTSFYNGYMSVSLVSSWLSVFLFIFYFFLNACMKLVPYKYNILYVCIIKNTLHFN